MEKWKNGRLIFQVLKKIQYFGQKKTFKNMLKILKVCAYPISILYGLILLIRNKFFDWHLLPSESFKIPLICVGNLSMGGTGKTPHIEYLIFLLQDKFNVAILSRGYGRQTKGFILVENEMSSLTVGDEVKQLSDKFRNITLAVSESRRAGIRKLIELHPEIEVILLDDAFQHRYVKPGLSILLSDYSNLYINDFVVPTGRLREFISGADRADLICITKSPKILSPIVSKDVETALNIKENQKLYFSYIKFGNFIPLYKDTKVEMPNKLYVILLFAGIVNTYPLEEYLKTLCEDLRVIRYNDHYQYNEKDINYIIKTYKDLYSVNKIIVTTEKDAKRLESIAFYELFKTVPVYYMPIEIEMHKKYKQDFDNQIINYVRKN